MRLLSIALVVALPTGPIAARAGDDPAVLWQVSDSVGKPSLVLTPQGVVRQELPPGSRTLKPPAPDGPERQLWSAKKTLSEVITSLACTSMFAVRPESQGTDPAASAGR